MRNPDALTTDCNNRSHFQCCSMPLENFGQQRNTLRQGDVRQTHQPGMGNSVYENQFAEIHVNGHQHSVFGSSVLEQRLVAGVRAKVVGEQGVMPLAVQPIGQPSPCASID